MSNKEKQDIIAGAIEGGLVGGALGAIFTRQGKGTIVSMLVGAAIGASLKAIKETKEIGVPVLYEENGIIYKHHPDGSKEVVKKIKKSQKTIPQTFTLE